MGLKRTDEFCKDAMRIALTSGLMRMQVTENLGVGMHSTYERVVEDFIFRDIVRRGADVIKMQELRYVTLSGALPLRFHDGMTRAKTYSHDNPASDIVGTQKPEEFTADIAALEKPVAELSAESQFAEIARSQLMPKK